MDEKLEQEFQGCLHRAGVTIPPDRLDIMRSAFLGYRDLAAVLDEKLPYGCEPLPAWTPDETA